MSLLAKQLFSQRLRYRIVCFLHYAIGCLQRRFFSTNCPYLFDCVDTSILSFRGLIGDFADGLVSTDEVTHVCGFYRRGFSPPYTHTLLLELLLRVDAIFALANLRRLLRRRIFLGNNQPWECFYRKGFSLHFPR